jgi:hypothetical protein
MHGLDELPRKIGGNRILELPNRRHAPRSRYQAFVRTIDVDAANRDHRDSQRPRYLAQLFDALRRSKLTLRRLARKTRSPRPLLRKRAHRRDYGKKLRPQILSARLHRGTNESLPAPVPRRDPDALRTRPPQWRHRAGHSLSLACARAKRAALHQSHRARALAKTSRPDPSRGSEPNQRRPQLPHQSVPARCEHTSPQKKRFGPLRNKRSVFQVRAATGSVRLRKLWTARSTLIMPRPEIAPRT